MNITWHGLSCFEIEAKTAQGDVRIVADPYENTTGLRFPRTLEAEILLVSHNETDANNTSSVLGRPYLINLPGEYEVRDVFVFGIPLNKGNIAYCIEAEGMRLAHLGALNRALTDDELQKLGNVDVLMVPVGGGRVLSPSTASDVIGQIEPRIVIPMMHAVDGVKEKLSGIEEFCKALGTCKREDMNKLKITAKELPEEEMKIVSLTR
jgi:L-ascorbate metabolism protein UlaG (beta-lactamase superfamily)